MPLKEGHSKNINSKSNTLRMHQYKAISLTSLLQLLSISLPTWHQRFHHFNPQDPSPHTSGHRYLMVYHLIWATHHQWSTISPRPYFINHQSLRYLALLMDKHSNKWPLLQHKSTLLSFSSSSSMQEQDRKYSLKMLESCTTHYQRGTIQNGWTCWGSSLGTTWISTSVCLTTARKSSIRRLRRIKSSLEKRLRSSWTPRELSRRQKPSSSQMNH